MKQDRTALNAEHFRMSVDLHRPISLEILLEWVLSSWSYWILDSEEEGQFFGFPDTLLLVRLKTTVPKLEIKPNTSQERKKSKGSDEPKVKTLIMILFFSSTCNWVTAVFPKDLQRPVFNNKSM